MIGRWRLRLKNIQRRAGDDAGLDRVIKRALINQPTARTVDNAHTLLHFLEGLNADNPARLCG